MTTKGLPGAQLTLGVHLRDDATFTNFLGPRNQAAAQRLAELIGDSHYPVVYLCGDSGTGKSHLLQAACLDMEARGGSALCLSMPELQHHAPEALQGLEAADLVCLDSVDMVAGDPAWEEAIFHLYNRVWDAGHHLLLSGRLIPADWPQGLADLRSRLMASVVLQLLPPRDEDRVEILQARAERRGLFMTDEVAQYILRRAPRHAGALLELLQRLDAASLASQRRLTVPFVKEVMGW